MPVTISVNSGEASATLYPGNNFEWTNTSAGTCAVTMTGAWCDAVSYSVPGGTPQNPGTAVGTVKAVVTPGDDYSFNCPCGVQVGTPHIRIGSTMPAAAREVA